MCKAWAIAALLGLYCFFGRGMPLAAQDQDYEQEEEPDYNEDISVETDWDGYTTGLYSRGDQTFTISAGISFPAIFLNNGTKISHHLNPPVGGTGSLAYTYFWGAHYFLGGEIGVDFNYTLGQNTVFLIPIGLRTGWQFIIGRFEIPLTATVGFAPQRYLDNSYVGVFLKGGVSVFFRFSPGWSFGLNTDWSWYPQRPEENGRPVPAKNVDGNFAGLTLSARYHF